MGIGCHKSLQKPEAKEKTVMDAICGLYFEAYPPDHDHERNPMTGF